MFRRKKDAEELSCGFEETVKNTKTCDAALKLLHKNY